MARQKIRTYIPPEGWVFHSPTGRYWEKLYTTDEQGNKYVVMNWFNPINGTYQQNTYRIDPATGISSYPKEEIPKDPSPLKRNMLLYPTAQQKMIMLAVTGVALVVVCIALNFLC